MRTFAPEQTRRALSDVQIYTRAALLYGFSVDVDETRSDWAMRYVADVSIYPTAQLVNVIIPRFCETRQMRIIVFLLYAAEASSVVI